MGLVSRLVVNVLTLINFALAMQTIHELGHIGAAMITGGDVLMIDLHPLRLSQTIISPDPSPMFVAWAGAIVGVAFPMILWQLCNILWDALSGGMRLFAGFCLVANGVYISVGVLYSAGDSRSLLELGAPPWLLVSFGAITVPVGLWLWHKHGQYKSTERDEVSTARLFFLNVSALIAQVALGLLMDRRTF